MRRLALTTAAAAALLLTTAPAALADYWFFQGYLPQTSRLAEAVRQSNQFIYNQARKDARQAGMGTTVVAVCIVAIPQAQIRNPKHEIRNKFK